MAYTSTPEDIRRARLLGIVYILMVVILSYMLFKIWPPVPWPSDKYLRDNPRLALALKSSLEECSPTRSPSRTVPSVTAGPTTTPTPSATVTPVESPSVNGAATPSPSASPSPSATPSPSPVGALTEEEQAVSEALVGNIPINFFGYWCVPTSFDERLILLVIIAAMLGSFVHGATSLADYIGNNNFNRTWTWFYLLRPAIGMALALVFYFVIRGGFLTTTGGAQDINPYGIAALAGLVGMFSKQATDKLGEVFSTLFRSSKGEGDDKRSGALKPASLTVADIAPKSVPAGTTNQTVTVTGTGFSEQSIINVNDAAQATTFVSDTQLTGQLDDALLVAAATLKLKVVNAGAESAAIDFTVT